ncbi:MAG: hypothetical protein IT434_15580 [Phycisphaerales bacterium]|nr:hypothetical protein [Phycisphaerales bacterium]
MPRQRTRFRRVSPRLSARRHRAVSAPFNLTWLLIRSSRRCAFGLDCCSYPVAAMTETGPDAPLPTGMMLDDAWLAVR